MGIAGVIDLLKKNEDGHTWTLYDYKRGSAARDSGGNPCVKEADAVQVQMYILLASRHHFSITRGIVYYAEEKRCVEVVQSRDEKELHALIAAVRKVAAGDFPPPLESDNRCLFCSMNPVCLPEESLYWKKAEENSSSTAEAAFGGEFRRRSPDSSESPGIGVKERRYFCRFRQRRKSIIASKPLAAVHFYLRCGTTVHTSRLCLFDGGDPSWFFLSRREIYRTTGYINNFRIGFPLRTV